ncbi:hypothetical protein [Enterococcus wangshanyuanii]|uniref:HTH arsR-type domain-containing protein n=1 Tax=Enterococcus wangshanyuanii TaxID=2005703 RepID=A0ABQ1NTM7_9ENTE|nr:hypothetical protein [Enterococcus wangshanyuanii]GGC84473.1 hypothetical protein GCM10011573_12640 [Enterococcus wangshanyuanii]
MQRFTWNYERSNKRWRPDENETLKNNALFDVTNDIVNINELAEILKRSPGAVKDQIKKLRKIDFLPKKKCRRKRSAFVFRLDNINYDSNEAKAEARKLFKEVSAAAEYIYQNNLTVLAVRQGKKNEDDVFIDVRNMNGLESMIKVQNEQAFVIRGNMRHGWKLAATW